MDQARVRHIPLRAVPSDLLLTAVGRTASAWLDRLPSGSTRVNALVNVIRSPLVCERRKHGWEYQETKRNRIGTLPHSL